MSMEDAPDYLREVEGALRNDPMSTPPGTPVPERKFSDIADGEQVDALLGLLIAALTLRLGRRAARRGADLGRDEAEDP